MKKTILTLVLMTAVMVGYAQDAAPTVTFFSKEDNEEVTLAAGEEKVAEAPLDIACSANVECPDGYSYKVEWRVFKENEGEDKPLVTRFDDDMKYTISGDGAYGIKLYVTFTDADGKLTDYESEKIKVVIATSKLSCPDGFSPNGDGINDTYKITCQSIVKVSGVITNRWGQRLHTFTVENLADGWDGLVGGRPVKDGVYFITLNAYGSDGIHYKIKKAINVLKGFRENTETSM